jgi:hypothetical protein
MKFRSWLLGAMSLGAIASAMSGCHSGDVGAECLPEDEYSQDIQGFALDEVDAENRSFQCETRVCLVNHFQGRVSCPYGQTEQQAQSNPQCFVPDSSTPIRGAVSPQLLGRRARDAVYCSCRCNGPDHNARYCDCPSGFSCQDLVPALGLGEGELTGSYCVREGTTFVSGQPISAAVCDASQQNCK